MAKYLVTGPGGFLGYHVIKRLNEAEISPRILLPRDRDASSREFRCLDRLETEVCEADFADAASLEAACTGIDIVLHLAFAIGLGDGDEVERTLHEGNVVATRRLLDAAAKTGVGRMVVSSSALAVGLNREPSPLDESADWSEHAFHLPYAMSRREAELEALGKSSDALAVVVVNPSFTIGPEDYVGAPANKLASRMTSQWFRVSAPIGFGVLDVRDYATGVLAAAERGAPGARYILSGANVDAAQLAREVAAACGTQPPGWFLSIPAWFVKGALKALSLWKRLRGQTLAVSPALLELWRRHAWYDTSRARDELGWEPRPLRESLKDSLAWMRDHPADQV